MAKYHHRFTNPRKSRGTPTPPHGRGGRPSTPLGSALLPSFLITALPARRHAAKGRAGAPTRVERSPTATPALLPPFYDTPVATTSPNGCIRVSVVSVARGVPTARRVGRPSRVRAVRRVNVLIDGSVFGLLSLAPRRMLDGKPVDRLELSPIRDRAELVGRRLRALVPH